MNDRMNSGYFSSFSFHLGKTGSAKKGKRPAAIEKKLKKLKKLTNYKQHADIAHFFLNGFFIGFVSYFVPGEWDAIGRPRLQWS